MQLTIIPSDKVVYIDSVSYGDIDMAWVPDIDEKKIRAVQWLDGSGEIEFVGPHQNLEITKLGVFENAVSLWNEKKKESDNVINQRLEEDERLKKEKEKSLKEIEDQFIRINFEEAERWRKEEETHIEKWRNLQSKLSKEWETKELARMKSESLIQSKLSKEWEKEQLANTTKWKEEQSVNFEKWKETEKLAREAQFTNTQKWKEEELLNIEKWKEVEKSSLLKWQEEELANAERWKAQEIARLSSYLPTEDVKEDEDDDDTDNEADLFYDIEELLKEI